MPIKETAKNIRESYVYFLVMGNPDESALSANSRKKNELPPGFEEWNTKMFERLLTVFEKFWTFSEAKPVVIESETHKGLLGTNGTPYFYFYLLRYGAPERSPYIFYLAKSDEQEVRLTTYGFNHCCTGAHLILMVKGIQRQLEKAAMGISDNNWDTQIRNGYKALPHKTLLIPREELSKGISAEDIKKVYPYPFELTNLAGIEKAVSEEDASYAVLLNRYSVAINGTSFTTPGIFDASTGMEIWYPPTKLNATTELIKLRDIGKMANWE